jgi:hypothetical protein
VKREYIFLKPSGTIAELCLGSSNKRKDDADLEEENDDGDDDEYGEDYDHDDDDDDDSFQSAACTCFSCNPLIKLNIFPYTFEPQSQSNVTELSNHFQTHEDGGTCRL